VCVCVQLHQYVCLTDDQIGAAGAQALAESLTCNNSLRCLDVGVNKIGDVGARALAEALARNSTLTRLNIADNLIGVDAARDLLQAVKTNSTVLCMDVSENPLDGSLERHISEAVDRNRQLQVECRHRFVCSMVLLVRTNYAGRTSSWLRLPPDVRRLILLQHVCLDRRLSSAIGKSATDMQGFVRFLLDHVREVNAKLSCRRGVRVVEKSNEDERNMFHII